MESLKAALQSEQIEKARLDMARENLESNITAMRANLQQLSRELAYHRTAPDPPALEQQQEGPPTAEVTYRAMRVCADVGAGTCPGAQRIVETGVGRSMAAPVQGGDVQRTVALMEAKIRRLQGIITRSQPQEELNLRTIHSLEQVPPMPCCQSHDHQRQILLNMT